MRWIACLFFLILLHSAYAELLVQDDMAQQLALPKPATRIISLAPDITEDLFAIGVGANVVGVIAGSDYPQAAKDKTIVGSYSGLDLERIITLQPDLIVTWSNAFARQILILRQLKIPVYVATPVQLEDVPRTIINLGILTGHQQQAFALAADFKQQLVTLNNQYHSNKPVKVFYQLGSYSLMTLNKKSWVNQVISLCGGQNIFADAKIIAPEVSWEAIINANPEIVLTDAKQLDWRNHWQAWPMIDAVKNKRLYSIDPDLIDRAGPRLIEGVKRICELIATER